MATPDFSTSTASQGGGSTSPGPETLTPLEQEVLDEYARLAGNLGDLAALLNTLSANPSADILDALRGLERKTSLVFTLLKASVYSIVLQQQIIGEEEEGGGGGEGASGVGGREDEDDEMGGM
ncbi:dash complex subunit dad3 [Diplodia corticola]|uniref:DASH complex subunit DAD3 n=1 Tax=Diplodia corticola TaxID=236234 RepID=A0A1J9RBN5_9PEZI|nr:dash complex subunit dad3 [Diplodia corticola]OJD37968.1 dash complex subunit dad3 [Diplodia corticola]